MSPSLNLLAASLVLLAPALQSEAALEGTPIEASAATPAAPSAQDAKEPPLELFLHPDAPVLRVPRNEMLRYKVKVSLGVATPTVGTVELTTGIEPFRSASVLGGKAPSGESTEQAWMKAHGGGNYLFYTANTDIESRVLPQDWPQTIYRFTQTGTEPKRQELKMGIRGGKPTSSYREDTNEGAPRGARIWKKPGSREVPPVHFDMINAIYVMRAMVQDGKRELTIPLLDKWRLWNLTLHAGKRSRLEVPAGTFDVVKVTMSTVRPPGEPDEGRDFKGLFGLHGTIGIYIDLKTGVPVKISGVLPVGPIDLGVDISLIAASGTPPGFASL
jgi:hypothetical protein